MTAGGEGAGLYMQLLPGCVCRCAGVCVCVRVCMCDVNVPCNAVLDASSLP